MVLGSIGAGLVPGFMGAGLEANKIHRVQPHAGVVPKPRSPGVLLEPKIVGAGLVLGQAGSLSLWDLVCRLRPWGLAWCWGRPGAWVPRRG